MSSILEVTEDHPSVVLEEVEYVEPTGGDPGGGVGIPDRQPVPFGTSSEPLSVNFGVNTSSVLEGESKQFGVFLSRTMSEPVVVDVRIGSASTTDPGAVTLSTDRIVFPIGTQSRTLGVDTTGTAGGDGQRIAYIELVQTPLGAEPGAFEVEPLASAGPTIIALTVQDQGGGSGSNPVWSFGVPASGVNAFEGTSDEYTIQLDRQATVVERFTVQVAPGGDAEEGRDYEPFEREVLIGEGDSSATFPIEFTENTLQPPTNPVLYVTATAQTALPGTPTTFPITILDNDEGGGGSSTARINWTQLNVTMNEGGSRTVTARITVNGTPQGFSDVLAVPLRYGGDQDQFVIDFGSAPDDTLVFEAGSATASIVVNSVDDDVAASLTIDFDLTGSNIPTNLRAGSIFRTTITSNLVELEETTLHVPGMAGVPSGAQRMIQGLCAVVPPSQSLPQYKLSTGELVQLVGHTRDANNDWVAAYFYALAPAAESIAGEAAALRLLPAQSSDPAPTAAGDFGTPPIITFRLAGNSFGERIGNTAQYPTSAGFEGSIPTLTREWTGPNGRWAQRGPELVRQREYTIRPLNPSVQQNINNTSPDTLGYIEVCETQIAGDPNVVLYECQWVNGAWAGPQQGTDAFTVNPYCDGNVLLESIEARAFQGTFGNLGWKLDLVDAHISQLQIADDRLLVLRGRGGVPYFFPTCQAYTFRFVAYREDAEPESALRATDYHRYKHIAWTVGGLGSTRNRIYGDTGDYTVDWARAGLNDPTTQSQGWHAIKELGEDWGDGYGSQGGCIADWTDPSGGVYPFSQTAEKREGWHHPLYPDGGGRSSGRGIYGSSGHVPWWGYWYAKSMELHKVTCRIRHQYRDMVTGATPFWWEVAKDVGGNWHSPIGGAFGKATARNRHWHFASDFDDDTKIATSNPSQLRLAPTNRPWNGAGTADPNYDRIKTYETFHETHMPRERTGHVDGWWGLRSYLAFKSYEGRAASLTRSHSPLTMTGPAAGDFSAGESNFAGLLFGQSNHPDRQGLGMQVGPSQAYITADFLRAWGWLMIVSSGFYAVADDDTRGAFQGFGRAAQRGGHDWFRAMGDILEFFCEETGQVGRGYAVAGPNPYSRDTFGEPDYCQKTGAIPKAEFMEGQPCRPLPSGELTLPMALGFHQYFCVRGVAAMRKHVFRSPAGSHPDFLRRALEWHSNFIRGARAFLGLQQYTPHDGKTFVPHAIVPAIDTDGGSHTEFSDPLPARGSLAQLVSGDLFWFFNRIDGGSSPGPVGWNEHNSKSGWTSVAGFQALGNEEDLDITRSVYDRSGGSDEAMVAFLMEGDSTFNASINSEMTSQNGGKRISDLGERSFLIPVLAEYLNRIS